MRPTRSARVHRPVPGEARLPGEGRGADGHAEVALAALLVARVAAVTLALVDHLELGGREGRLERVTYLFGA
jgi:hypothetical protein